MEKAKVHQGLWCCHCCWWWVPLESSCKLLRVLLSAGVGPTWQRLISYTKFGSESWKKDVDMFASSAISWLLCLSSSDMLLTATTNVSSSAINRLLLLYYLQWLFDIPGSKIPTIKLCCDPLYSPHKLQDVQCYITLWQVTIFHMVVSGTFP